MNTQLDDDIRTLFAELAEATTITDGARFGDISVATPPSHRRRWPALVAAAACIALVGGLAVAVRDGQPQAPAATTAPEPSTAPPTTLAAPLPQYLFPEVLPDGTPLPPFTDPVELVESYLQSRSLEAPEGLTVEYRLTPELINEARSTIGYEMTVRSTQGADTATGSVFLEQVDRSWYVVNASSSSLSIDSILYEAGVVSGTFTTNIGGAYLVTLTEAVPVDDPGPSAMRPLTIEARPNEPTSWSFEEVGRDVVRVTFWHSPSADYPRPEAVFAEVTLARGSGITMARPSAATTLPTATMPAVVGLTVEQATNLLNEVGLAYELSSIELSPGDERSGTVVGQDVPAGETVDLGTVIRITHAF